ncbi:glycosyltransferase [Mycobacterium sp.]|uniref:glycosyltransferase n=1 Tax=Mycobacterium sp. TaxID=1785 RepID=UPI003C7075FA
MATILAYTSPALGHLLPMSALLSELSGRGHRIHVRTLSAGVPTGRRLGFHTEAIDARIEAVTMEDWRAPNGLAALKVSIGVLCGRAAYEVNDLRRALAQVQPEVLIIDVNCWGAQSVADAAGIPWLVFSPYTPFLTSRGAPPFGPGLKPLPGVVGRLRDSAVRPVVTGLLERAMLPALNKVRADVGAPEVRPSDEFLRRAALMLVATGEPFEYPHPDWGASVQLIGPCAVDPGPHTVPDWLAAIDEPIVLVTISSEPQADGRLVLAAMDALADDPVHVVATFPAGLPENVPVPANATVRGFVPHGPVLDRAVCAVTHGGMGATQKALAKAVPVCVVPFGRDQLEVARRVEVSCCGTRLPVKKLTPARLRDGAAGDTTGTCETRGHPSGARGHRPRLMNLVELIEQRIISAQQHSGPKPMPGDKAVQAVTGQQPGAD